MKLEYEKYKQELIAKKRLTFGNFRDQVPTAIVVRAECRNFCDKFIKKFPYLTLQIGFYHNAEHVWCVDVDGTIVDPYN